MTSQALEVSSEVSITVQTQDSGVSQEWQLLGWVVECQMLLPEAGEHYQVTLLFSALPQGLLDLLSGDLMPDFSKLYPVAPGTEIFGLN